MNKKINKTFERLCEDVGAHNGALLAVVSDADKGDFYAVGDMSLVRNGITAMLKDSGRNAEISGIAYAIVNGLMDAIAEGFDASRFVEEDEEDCASCDKNLVCMNEAAVRYRKENGICGMTGNVSKDAN